MHDMRHGDHYFIGELREYICSAIKILQYLLFCEVCFINIAISLKILKIIYVYQGDYSFFANSNTCSANRTYI